MFQRWKHLWNINFYQTTWHNFPEDSHLHTHCHENLKSHLDERMIEEETSRGYFKVLSKYAPGLTDKNEEKILRHHNLFSIWNLKWVPPEYWLLLQPVWWSFQSPWRKNTEEINFSQQLSTEWNIKGYSTLQIPLMLCINASDNCQIDCKKKVGKLFCI
jgi:hypothetical protein